MFRRPLAILATLSLFTQAHAQTESRSVTVGPGGAIYQSQGDGVSVVKDAKTLPFAKLPDQAKGLVAFQKWLFVVAGNRVHKIDLAGKVTTFDAFDPAPKSLTGLAVDERGMLYATDAVDDGAIYRVDPKGKTSRLKRAGDLKSPTAIVMDGMSHLLVTCATTGELLRVKIADGSTTKIVDGLGRPEALAWDHYGRLYILDAKAGRVSVIPRPGQKPITIPESFKSPTALCLDPAGKSLIVLDGGLSKLPTQVPGQPVDDSSLPIKAAVAFPKLEWAGWKGFTDEGKQFPLRPMLLTHAGDGSNRVFVPIQQGTIHVFPNDQGATKTTLFLDIQKRVSYIDKENEEGLLGLAFHPNYKTNGEFFVYYTIKSPKRTNVLSRFRVSKDDPNRADPDSEVELFRITRPYWNHDAGTICFGPDGYLYVALGDGGAGNDPHRNGQNLKTMLSKVLRLDVSRKEAGKNYAIPNDNPFVDRADALPEIWAYGFRNIWRMAFDRKTGKLWASDVGQNLYEEINIVVKGGNYGWSLREGLHPFSDDGVGPRADLADPIWEYHHDVGKSITGGVVYRGKALPELDGHYLYGDYVTGNIYALQYDEGKGRVVANRRIAGPNLPIHSFGEDEHGEAYMLAPTVSGKSIYRFERK